ncbi:MAG: GNAT family N-acetyltransferase [Chloroflexi bacterium]|nr:GNAT family N-acetyltransferase [Chloroflexota bacterium]
MIEIRPLQAHETEAAKWVIASVAQRIYYPEKTPQYFYDVLAEEGELRDVDECQNIYTGDHGLFLAVLDEDRLVGTGAIKHLEADIAELKRLWLLEDYHGRGIGYQVVQRLLEFARAQGWFRIRLQTGGEQLRALAFYKKLGFIEIPSYRESMDDISMELRL